MSSRAALRSRPTRLPDPPRARLAALPRSPRTAPVRRPGPVRSWLVVTRAAVLPLTLGAGLVGGLLAVRADGYAWPLHLLAVVGLVLAHVGRNLLVELSGRGPGPAPAGLDPASPLRSGLVRRRHVGLAVIGLSVALVATLAALALLRGWPVLAVAAAGAVLSGLGRPGRRTGRVFRHVGAVVVWGPLMVAGTCFAALGALPWQVWPASLPYGLLCASVLLGRDLDGSPHDTRAGPPTDPVRLAEPGARALGQLLLVGSYATTGLAVAVGALPWPALVVALGLPLMRSVAGLLRRPRPGGAAGRSWAAPALMRHGLCGSGLLLLGLVLAAVLDVGVPLG